MDFRQGAILWWIPWFLLGLSAAAGQDGGKLTGAVGGNITLPALVNTDGSLEFRDKKKLAVVFKRDSSVYYDDFKDRLQWDRQTGLFTIRQLRINDTGTYTVEDSIRQNNSIFHLTVYNQVSKPQVRAAAPCWVECSVENGRDVSLSWYRGEERLNQTSSPDLSRVLSLVLVSDSNTSYSCVVENPVSRETINMPDTCRTIGDPEQDDVERRHWLSIVIVSCSVFIIVVVLLVVYLKRKTPALTQQGSVVSDRQQPQEEEVQYAEVTVISKRSDQCNLSELGPGLEKKQDLTSVYDKLQLHRIAPPSPDTSHEDEGIE